MLKQANFMLAKIFHLCYTINHPIPTIVGKFLLKLLPSDKAIAKISD